MTDLCAVPYGPVSGLLVLPQRDSLFPLILEFPELKGQVNAATVISGKSLAHFELTSVEGVW